MLFVSGATGKLGREVLDLLLTQVPAEQVRTMARRPEGLVAYAQRGVEVVKADYDEPESLRVALRGVQAALLISSNEVGRRAAQHAAFLGAACRAAVGRLVYTSLLRADVSKLAVAAEHWQTEEAIRQSGIPATILRNGWYFENYTDRLADMRSHRGLVGATRQGRISAASRRDYAEAAVQVLRGKAGVGGTHELAGDAAFTLPELVAEVERQTGEPLRYTDLAPPMLQATLEAAHVPASLAAFLVGLDEGIAAGELEDDTGDLQRLIGRPTTTLQQAVAAGLAAPAEADAADMADVGS